MKLVVTYQIGDGCTFGCEKVEPVEYESAEKFICDFEDWRSVNADKIFLYAGSGFCGLDLCTDQKPSDINVYTIDEWFDLNCPNAEKAPGHV